MAHSDLDELLDALLPFAQLTLAKRGEIYPFGAQMDLQGGIASAAGMPDGDYFSTQVILDVLIDGLKLAACKGEIIAAGVCIDVRVIPPGASKKTDAICVKLEHVTCEAIEVYLPYQKGLFGRIVYGELFADSGEPVVFSQTK